MNEDSDLEDFDARSENVPDEMVPCQYEGNTPIMSPQGITLPSAEDSDCCIKSPGSMASELVRSFFFAGRKQVRTQKRNDAEKPTEDFPKEHRIEVVEEEISKLRARNKHLESVIKEMEERGKVAAQEKDVWERKIAYEMEQLNSYKDLQIKELKKERRILEKHSRAFAQIPQKWERREIELLKFKISQLREESATKESRWRLTTNRLRKNNEYLTGKIQELQEEIKRYGVHLLTLWDTKETEVEERRDHSENPCRKYVSDECDEKCFSLKAKSPTQRPISLSQNRPTDERIVALNEGQNGSVLTMLQTKTGQGAHTREYGLDAGSTSPYDNHYLQADETKSHNTSILHDKPDSLCENLSTETDSQQQCTHSLSPMSQMCGISLQDSQMYGITKNVEQESTQLFCQQPFTCFISEISAPSAMSDLPFQSRYCSNSSIHYNHKKVQDSSSHSVPLLPNKSPKNWKSISLSEQIRAGSAETYFSQGSLTWQVEPLNYEVWQNFSKDTHSARCLQYEQMELNHLVKDSSVCHHETTVFPDGTRKEVHRNGLVFIHFSNGDISNSYPDGTKEYYYAEVNIWQTTKPDGVELYHVSYNQAADSKPI